MVASCCVHRFLEERCLNSFVTFRSTPTGQFHPQLIPKPQCSHSDQPPTGVQEITASDSMEKTKRYR